MRESTLQTKIIKELRRRGAYVFKVVGSPVQQRGTPDLLVCYKGHFYGIETKVGDNTTSPTQDLELMKITRAGGTARVVRSLEEMEGILDAG